ncbi:efflux RND transporter permease subunit [Halocella sp. SP3-1]|uniref:efflux RND transporter permease subunit n=1 Tax=Halocella sp. SP3-1 TaxID=2382161 RepID=UPI000F75B293|nr:efflux RND transporter permease subunit [Halocella sp. SP3-1]AZO94266.1 efflux RND transporter permease subunit [Halocella sp. SP3-1]
MKIADYSINKKITVLMVVIMILIFGYISFTRLGIDLFPDIDFPVAAVITNYSGIAPEEMESLVTKPIEEQLATVDDVKTISSTSSMGQSTVVVEFNWGRDLDFAALDIREKIDTIRDALPDDADDPLVMKFDPNSFPIMTYAVGGDYSLDTLKEMADNEIEPRLERIAGVASVNITGGKEREILVELDQNKMENYGVSISSIIQAISSENTNISAGNFTRGSKDLLVRTMGKFTDVDSIGEISIPVSGNQGFVPLDKIATVTDTFKDIEEISRVNDLTSIGISITKQSGTNTVAVAKKVKAEMAEIIKEMNLKSDLIDDDSEFIENAINNVVSSGLIGAILAVVILFIFLRNISSTIVIAVSIPISIIATFVLVYFDGLSLNMISLGGLTLGVGMVVDNSVVILENIYRHRASGMSRLEAASEGASEVSTAIIASTITTISIFVPMVFMEGLASQIFSELALTISFALLASLVIALTVVPTLSAVILHVKDKDRERHENDGPITHFYRNTLKWSVKHRGFVLILLLVVFIGSLGLAKKVGFEFFPAFDQGEFTINLEMPNGTVLEKTNQVIKQIEKEVKKISEVETYYATVGTTSSNTISGSISSEGSIDVSLVDEGQRERSTKDIVELLRNKLNIPDADITIAESSMGPTSSSNPIDIKILGDDLDTLEVLADKVVAEISQVEGVREADSSISEGEPELHINIDRELAARYNLRTGQIGDIVDTAVDGKAVSQYEEGDDEYDITVKFKNDESKGLDEIRNLLIPTSNGAKITLGSVANLQLTTGPQEINREDQERYVEVTANLYKVPLGTAMANIRERLNNLDLPAGYGIEYGGDTEDMMESFGQIGFALILGIVLLYMVMASQYQSLSQPFIIMFTVPMALIGVILGLFITGQTFSLPAGIGLLTLIGIVVNNAIVLVDYINTLRERGRTIMEAIIEAGPIRLRPVMMTALTTILALIPMAMGIGEGTEIQQPMAIVIASGLGFSTLLTLYIIPILYSYVVPFTEWVKSKFN